MRNIFWLASSLLLLFPGPCRAQQINPANQINWPMATGSGAPSAACTSANYGEPYTDTTASHTYVCTSSGWYQTDSGGGGGGGVTSINTHTGAFTFTGSGVACSGTTCNFPGVAAGVTNYAAYYNGSGTVGSEDTLSFSTPTVVATDVLQFNGGGGISITGDGQGPTDVIDATSNIENGAGQISLRTNTTITNSTSTPGQLELSASDSGGNSNAANIYIHTSETSSSINNNSGNISLSASSHSSLLNNTGGNVNLTASNDTGEGGAVNLTANGANSQGGINLTANGSGGDGGFINLLTVGGTGNINIAADTTTSGSDGVVSLSGREFTATFPDFTVDPSGNTTLAGSLTVNGGTPGIQNQGVTWLAGTSLPGTCSVGDFYNLTSASSATTAMQVCYPANTWNPLGQGSSMSGTPTYTLDSGAGTGATATIVAGSTDGAGVVSVVTGSTPSASAGVVTIKYGGTYGTTPRCVFSPASATAAALNPSVYIPNGTSSTSQFVFTIGSTALTASTTYVWGWSCQL